MVCGLVALGGFLWWNHLRAWDLGGRSPVLSYDSAQYALAAREPSDHGRLATEFALPVELVKAARPPWPLAVVQPGLVVGEAALFACARPAVRPSPAGGDPREWLVLVLPLLSYLGAAIVIALTVLRLLRRHASDVSEGAALLAATSVAAAYLLDPEAQHFASGGFTEMPFTLGLMAALAALALGWAGTRPLLFGLLLGLTGSFRANMLGLAPLFALGAAAIAPQGRRVRTLWIVILGYVVVGAPWWLYKWVAFGSPAWDLTRFVIWDHVEGRSWFSIYHVAHRPDVPSGAGAIGLLTRKVLHDLPALLLAIGTGPRALWLGALALWAAWVPGPRGPRIAAVVTLLVFVAGVVTAAMSIPWLRYVFPARVALEAAGLVALWGLLAHFAGSMRSGGTRTVAAAAAVLALAWGIRQTGRGIAEARETAESRDAPSAPALASLAARVNQELAPGEPLMSNLGPILAWSADRPVVHLALTPVDVEACRRLLDTRNVVLVYRDPERAGAAWGEVVRSPAEAPQHPEWNVVRARTWPGGDGFRVVWLELGPLRTEVAAAPGARRATRSPGHGDRVATRTGL
jgi:hypothetical protein